jgi:hypothetical protein
MPRLRPAEIKNVFQTDCGENVQVKVIRDTSAAVA